MQTINNSESKTGTRKASKSVGPKIFDHNPSLVTGAPMLVWGSLIVLLGCGVGLLIVLTIVFVDVSCVEVFMLTCVASFAEDYEVFWCGGSAFACGITVMGYKGYSGHLGGSAQLATVACAFFCPL